MMSKCLLNGVKITPLLYTNNYISKLNCFRIIRYYEARKAEFIITTTA